MMFQLKPLLNKLGFKNTYLPLVQNNTHDSLVMLMKQDMPTNYEESMVDQVREMTTSHEILY